MKERPILFSGPMVRAILDGRKTQTRRPAKFAWSGSADELMRQSRFDPAYRCPLGQPGDRLWVRETWQLCDYDGPGGYPETDIAYRADGETDDKRNGWRPSIHMPRCVSRITLEITRVSVERVQDITEEGAIKEGCVPLDSSSPREMFGDLWQSIYGTWEANPWVWAVEFRRVKP